VKPHISPPTQVSLSTAAESAAYLGILPFIASLAGMGLLPDLGQRALAQSIAIAWGATVLAFVGAVHWGLALAGRITWSPLRLAGSVLPAVVGAGAVALSGQRALGLLVVGFGVFWLYEHRNVADELPEDYLRLRRNLSVAVCSLLALTMILSESVGLS
jgi:Protein of unknown function (DUF3429)